MLPNHASDSSVKAELSISTVLVGWNNNVGTANKMMNGDMLVHTGIYGS